MEDCEEGGRRGEVSKVRAFMNLQDSLKLLLMTKVKDPLKCTNSSDNS